MIGTQVICCLLDRPDMDIFQMFDAFAYSVPLTPIQYKYIRMLCCMITFILIILFLKKKKKRTTKSGNKFSTIFRALLLYQLLFTRLPFESKFLYRYKYKCIHYMVLAAGLSCSIIRYFIKLLYINVILQFLYAI